MTVTEERFGKLEREVRIYRRILVAMAACVGAVFVTASVNSSKDDITDKLRVRNLSVVNKDGVEVIALGSSWNGERGAIHINDSKGKESITLQSTYTGAGVWLKDTSGNALNLSANNGAGAEVLMESAQGSRGELAADGKDAHFRSRNSDGVELAYVGEDPDSKCGVVGIWGPDSKFKVWMSGGGPDGSGLLDVGDADGSVVVHLAGATNGGGAIAVSDPSGNTAVSMASRENGGEVNLFNSEQKHALDLSVDDDGDGAWTLCDASGAKMVQARCWHDEDFGEYSGYIEMQSSYLDRYAELEDADFVSLLIQPDQGDFMRVGIAWWDGTEEDGVYAMDPSWQHQEQTVTSILDQERKEKMEEKNR